MTEKRAVYLSVDEIDALASLLHQSVKNADGRSATLSIREKLQVKFALLLREINVAEYVRQVAHGYVYELTEELGTLERTVHEALNNAYGEDKDPVFNMCDLHGHIDKGESFKEAIRIECRSLTDYDSDLEEYDPRELEQHVRSWIEKVRK